MNNYYKNKDLPSDVQAILRNKPDIKRVNSQSQEPSKNKKAHSYVYTEVLRCLRDYRRWALMGMHPHAPEHKKDEIEMKLSEFKNDVNEFLELAKEPSEISIVAELKSIGFYDMTAETLHELTSVTDEVERLIKKYED